MIRIVPLTSELSGAVKDFNAVMKASGVSTFPESPVSNWLPNEPGRRIYEEPFVAVEDGHVRGGYIFIRHRAVIAGETIPMAGLRLPISEAVVNRKYAMVPARLIKDAVSRQPILYGMGMDGGDAPVARLLKALKFRLEPVPFFFKITRPVRFFTGSHVMKPWMSKLAAYSGAASIATRAAGLALNRGHGLGRRVQVEVVGEFQDWTDELWEASQGHYSWAAVRDSHALNAIYRPSEKRFIRVRVWNGERLAGWAVLLDLQLKNDRRFGHVRAGQIVDCFAAPEDAAAVIHGACRFLEDRGVDFIRSHQSHPAWRNALRSAGCMQGKSYFLCGESPALQEMLDRADPQRLGVHLNRGDGDSPLYLPRRGTPAGAYPAAHVPEPVDEVLEESHVLGD